MYICNLIIGPKIDNLINEFSDRSKLIFSSAYNSSCKYETNLSSSHILYVILNDSEQYISYILLALTPKIEYLRADIFELLKRNKKI